MQHHIAQNGKTPILRGEELLVTPSRYSDLQLRAKNALNQLFTRNKISGIKVHPGIGEDCVRLSGFIPCSELQTLHRIKTTMEKDFGAEDLRVIFKEGCKSDDWCEIDPGFRI